MKFSEYLDRLNALSKKHPDLLEMPVIASADSEGNYYDKVLFEPSIGKWDGATDFYDYELGDCKKKDINAVCIN